MQNNYYGGQPTVYNQNYGQQMNNLGTIGDGMLRNVLGSPLAIIMTIFLSVNTVMLLIPFIYEMANDGFLKWVSCLLLFFMLIFPVFLSVGFWIIYKNAKKNGSLFLGTVFVKIATITEVVVMTIIGTAAIIVVIIELSDMSTNSYSSNQNMAAVRMGLVFLIFVIVGMITIAIMATIQAFKICNYISDERNINQFKGIGLLVTFCEIQIILNTFLFFSLIISFSPSSYLSVIIEDLTVLISSLCMIVFWILMIVQLVRIKKVHNQTLSSQQYNYYG